jgi:hypothetical protein
MSDAISDSFRGPIDSGRAIGAGVTGVVGSASSGFAAVGGSCRGVSLGSGVGERRGAVLSFQIAMTLS